MSKMIAVCGSPSSGKTTLALKFAQELYHTLKNATVLFLSPDPNIPSLGYLFPNCKDIELHSIGVVLDKTDITKEDVMKQFVNVKTMRNFAYLGLKLGENKYSYPVPTIGKIDQFFSVLKDCADYIIVDCSCEESDLISRIAKRDCDIAFQVINPDIRSIVYDASSVNQFLTIEDKKHKVLNIPEKELYLPLDEIKEHFGPFAFTLPYSRALKQQMITGTLSERLRDSSYRKVLSGMVKKVTA